MLGAAAIVGCSGGGFLPFGVGPHSIEQRTLNRIVDEQSKTHQVPAALLSAVITAESGGDPSAISEAGAMGLMQLMPATAQAYGVSNPFDARQNVEAGSAYLGDLLRLYNGNVTLALAAYNAGSGTVEKYGGVPPYAETKAYVRDVLSTYRGPSATR